MILVAFMKIEMTKTNYRQNEPNKNKFQLISKSKREIFKPGLFAVTNSEQL